MGAKPGVRGQYPIGQEYTLNHMRGLSFMQGIFLNSGILEGLGPTHAARHVHSATLHRRSSVSDMMSWNAGHEKTV